MVLSLGSGLKNSEERTGLTRSLQKKSYKEKDDGKGVIQSRNERTESRK